MNTSTRLRRAAIAVAGATVLAAGATGAGAAGQDPANEGATAVDAPTLGPATPPGTELQFVSVAPCRILDTRLAGGKLVNTSRVFDATLASYAGQGGKAGSCGIPDAATSVELNVGAISQNGSTSHVTVWATGTPEPLASIINYNPSGPVANMATVPINAQGRFTAKTPGTAHLFADVAGYYVKPLYAAITPAGATYFGISSGLAGSTRTSVGTYRLTFDRHVRNCSAVASDIIFATPREVTVDQTFSADAIDVVVRNSSTGALEDTYFQVQLTC